MQTLYNERFVPVSKDSEAISYILEGQFAYLSEYDYLEDIAKQRCDVTVVKMSNDNSGLSWIFKKDSFLHEMLNHL